MITLTDIAYVRTGVADLDAATQFATGIVGLELVTPTEVGVAHLRADQRHHCLALVEGPSGVISSGFTVANSDALDAAETELERSGISVRRGSAAEARSRRVREFIAFDDPFGNHLELVNQQEVISRPVTFSRVAGITEFGHLCLDAPDVHDAYRFWSTRFNARVSDWLGDAACLMRIDPVHHKLAVFKGDDPGLCHMNFQVATIDDLFRNWHFLVEHDVEIEMGPGRHPQSGAIFLPTSTPSASARSPTRQRGYPAPSTRPSQVPSTCGSARPPARLPSRRCAPPSRPKRAAPPRKRSGPASRSPRRLLAVLRRSSAGPGQPQRGRGLPVDECHRVRHRDRLVVRRAVGQHPQRRTF
jgi:2,3-dihydroxy-p-cumate/2,3-dihydroxybenzoate 3,4-dioxygenase